MTMGSSIRFLLRKLALQFNRNRFRRDLAEELETHEAMKIEEHAKAGLTLSEAARKAKWEMGNVTVFAEQAADVRSFVSLEQLMHDVRYALRMLKKNPGLSIVAILSLALGIGGCTAVFSMLNALLIKPLPFGEPQRLVRITEFFPKALMVYFQQRCRSMEIASVSPGQDVTITRQGPAYRITASAVSANLFSVLRVPVRIGRGFESYEDQPGRNRVAILSHHAWSERFNSDPAVIGRMITVNGIDRMIVGVMPARFVFPSASVQLWFPAQIDQRQQVDYWAGEFTPLIGRLRPGATIEQARSEMKALAHDVWQMFPWPMPRHWNANATAIPLQIDLAGDARGRLLMLLCTVGIVLIIASANVAGLLTARGLVRRKELATRAALGAGQSRIVRQLLIESIVLASIAGAAGVILGASALQILRAVIPADLPGAAHIGIDWNVIAFTATLSLLTGISFGSAPSFTAAQLNLLETIKAGGQRSATAASLRLRSWLITGEVALTFMLVIGAILLVRSLYVLSNKDPGFKPQGVLALKISPDPTFCATASACVAFYDRALHMARGVRGVVDTALANTIPLDGSAPTLPVDVEDHPKSAEFPAPMFWTGAITHDYLRLMGIPLFGGRFFNTADGPGSQPVVLITASTARRFWPGQNAIGKHIKFVSDSRWRTVVGVVADVRQFNLTNRPPAGITGAMYVPYSQSIDGNGGIPSVMNLVVKAGDNVHTTADDLRRSAIALNPNIPVSEVVRLTTLVDDSVSNFRSTAWVFLAFASVALVLAAVGTYGLIAYSVTQRTYEIAVRIAVGATGSTIIRMVLAGSLRVTLLGIATGLVGAPVASRALSFLFAGVTSAEPAEYTLATIFLLVVSLIASVVPAVRASHIDPAHILRAGS